MQSVLVSLSLARNRLDVIPGWALTHLHALQVNRENSQKVYRIYNLIKNTLILSSKVIIYLVNKKSVKNILSIRTLLFQNNFLFQFACYII
jgi:hypothetical protein